MTTKKLTDQEISTASVASLPTRPTAPKAFGGKGYTASDMKAAFDRLPLLIAERFNKLLDDITVEGNGSLAAAIPTGIYDGHTLSKLFEDLKSGELSGYLSVPGGTLATVLGEIKAELEEIKATLEISTAEAT